MVPLKHLSSFWRTPGIHCEINIILTSYEICIVKSTTID